MLARKQLPRTASLLSAALYNCLLSYLEKPRTAPVNGHAAVCLGISAGFEICMPGASGGVGGSSGVNGFPGRHGFSCLRAALTLKKLNL